MNAAQKARIRWGSDRRQRDRQRLRDECRRTKERLSDPKHRADLEQAIGADAVARIIRANEEMLNDLAPVDTARALAAGASEDAR